MSFPPPTTTLRSTSFTSSRHSSPLQTAAATPWTHATIFEARAGHSVHDYYEILSLRPLVLHPLLRDDLGKRIRRLPACAPIHFCKNWLTHRHPPGSSCCCFWRGWRHRFYFISLCGRIVKGKGMGEQHRWLVGADAVLQYDLLFKLFSSPATTSTYQVGSYIANRRTRVVTPAFFSSIRASLVVCSRSRI
ncbi:hypothetical protein R3P38DRAFT_804232 [Favolaschia claudopus]|uniref:Uncharacterized protein n=1 Tax=Favolaschia claudopus TaxID=2862362 RepID=A0AAV9Z2G1_9AGAR